MQECLVDSKTLHFPYREMPTTWLFFYAVGTNKRHHYYLQFYLVVEPARSYFNLTDINDLKLFKELKTEPRKFAEAPQNIYINFVGF